MRGEVGKGDRNGPGDEEEKYFRHGYSFKYKNRVGEVAAL